MSVALRNELIDLVRRIAPPESAAWLTARMSDRASLAASFSAAGRHLGRAPIGEHTLGIPWSATSGVDECGRAALVLAAIEALPADDHVALIADLVRRGDVRERQAVLRVLGALPDPERFVDIAVDACRTNVLSVFEAIACDNGFPAHHFSDAAFGQLTLKALFIGAPLARVVGLASRTTDELIRMVEAYASERRAAGRLVPDDVTLVRKTP